MSKGAFFSNHLNYSSRFPDKSNNDDKHDHGQENRRPSTYVEGINTNQKQINNNKKTKKIYIYIYIYTYRYGVNFVGVIALQLLVHVKRSPSQTLRVAIMEFLWIFYCCHIIWLRFYCFWASTPGKCHDVF